MLIAMLKALAGKKEIKVVIVPKEPFPSALNPCPRPGTSGHFSACLWDVGGRVTKVCNGCVADREKKIGDRHKALQTFNSDLTGNKCL